MKDARKIAAITFVACFIAAVVWIKSQPCPDDPTRLSVFYGMQLYWGACR